MVASPPAHRFTVAALLACLLLSAVPAVVPSASAQIVPVGPFSVNTDTAFVGSSGDGAVSHVFYDTGSSVFVHVNVSSGSLQAPNVAVPIMVSTDAADPVSNQSAFKCDSLPTAGWISAGQGGGFYQWYNKSVVVPGLSNSAFNLSVLVNTRTQPTGWQNPNGCNPTPVNEQASSPIPGANTEHHVTLPYIHNARVDFQITSLTWCDDPDAQDGDTPNPTDCQDLNPATHPFNVTSQATSRSEADHTFFKIGIENRGTWASSFMPDGTTPFKIPYTTLLTGAGVGFNADVTVPQKLDSGADNVITTNRSTFLVGNLSLFHAVGAYTPVVQLNVGNAIAPLTPMLTGTNKTATATFQVASWDFAGGLNASTLHTDPLHPYDWPFLPDGNYALTGNVTVRNLGTASVPQGVHVVAKLDNNLVVDLGTLTMGNATSPDGYREFPVTFHVQSSDPASSTYVAAGQHEIEVVVDPNQAGGEGNGTYFEPNELNNDAAASIYFNQTSSPATSNVLQVLGGPGAFDAAANPQIPLTYPWKTFYVHANFTEGDDTQHLRVVANFTLASNASVSQTFPLVYGSDTFKDARWSAEITNFSYVGNGTQEVWNLKVVATDPFGHSTPLAWTGHSLLLQKWPVQWLNDSALLTEVDGSADVAAEQNYVVPYSTGSPPTYNTASPTYKIRVFDNWTGFVDWSPNGNGSDQINYAGNLHITYNPPRNQTSITGQFPYTADCSTVNTVRGRGSTGNVLNTGSTDQNPWNSTNTGGVTGGATGCQSPADRWNFTAAPTYTGGTGPGVYGVDIQIADKTGEVRHVFRNFTLQDSPPTLTETTIKDLDDVNATNSSVAGHRIQVHVNATDDYNVDSGSVYMLWTRPGQPNATFNFTLKKVTTPPGTVATYVYNDTFTVGRDAQLNVSGKYQVTFRAKDTNGNWNTSTPIEFSLNETVPPAFTSAGVDPSEQELRQPVTFYASVSAQFNPKLFVTVKDQNSAVVVDRQPMTIASGTGNAENFTYTANFTTSGTYTYDIDVQNSQGVTPGSGGTSPGSFVIQENLGPRIELKSPSVNVGGVLYAPAAPTLTFLVYDGQGVDNATFNLTLDGAQVPTTISPAPAGLNGYYFQYVVPQGQAYQDGQVVTVNVSVFDLTGLQAGKVSLQSFDNLTFTVDAKAPAARVTDFAPRYKSGASQLWNVSLSTKFTLAADPSTSPVPVDRIVFSIVGGQRSVTATYGGPFSLSDYRDVYVGSTVYTITVWAYDAVGNADLSHRFQQSFYLDDESPHLALPLTQGRYLNWTIVDEQTGVKSATLWARADNAPYQPYAMVKDAVGDVWRGVLPEGTKGQLLTYYVQAVDNVDNNADGADDFGTAASPYASLRVTNHDPVVKITSPEAGSRRDHLVDVAWTAADADKDPLTYTVYYKAPGKDALTELAKIDNPATTRFQLDTTTLADGEYTIRVTVSDGTVATYDEVPITIINAGSAIGAVSPIDDVKPGDQVLVTAQILKAGATVEAQVFRNGNLLDSFAMNDEGKDGDAKAGDHVFSAQVPVGDSGDYSVTIVAHYTEDGQTRESTLTNAATFSAALTPGYILHAYAGLLILLALLAVVGVAIAVFVVVRRKG